MRRGAKISSLAVKTRYRWGQYYALVPSKRKRHTYRSAKMLTEGELFTAVLSTYDEPNSHGVFRLEPAESPPASGYNDIYRKEWGWDPDMAGTKRAFRIIDLYRFASPVLVNYFYDKSKVGKCFLPAFEAAFHSATHISIFSMNII
jgi:hypothetical protein